MLVLRQDMPRTDQFPLRFHLTPRTKDPLLELVVLLQRYSVVSVMLSSKCSLGIVYTVLHI